MNRATIIDGKLIAQGLRNTIAKHTANLLTQGIKPGLAVVLVGEDPASQVYVRNKHQQSLEVGFNSFEHRLPASTSQAELLTVVQRLNDDASVHGILVQLPLPKHIAEQAVLNAIHPDKDVDGFHPINAGRLAIGKPLFAPCTPVGCEILVRSVLPNLSGAHAVIIGRSNIVGKPVAQLLLAANCTVTITHSHTKNLAELVKQADVVIAAIGKPNFVRGAWLKPGAIVIDVGINRVPDEREGAAPGKTRLIGDVNFEEAMQVASAVTPVPGGVGPMTIACLLRSTFLAACHANQQPIPSDL